MIKNIIFLFVAIVMIACDNDKYTLDESLTLPQSMNLMPAQDSLIEVDPGASPSLAPFVLSWDAASTDDDGLILYQVVFQRVYTSDDEALVLKDTLLSGRSGASLSLSLTHKMLSTLATTLGIGPLQTGGVSWSVIASKGSNSLGGTESKSFSLMMPDGIAVLPTQLYLYGNATENADGIPMKVLGDGQFEVITSLSDGEFYFEEVGGSKRKFTLKDGANSRIEEGSAAVISDFSGDLLRIRLDFNLASSTFNQVVKLEMKRIADWGTVATFTYEGNHICRAENVQFDFYTAWGWDEDRYKFLLYTSDSDFEEYGSAFQTNMIGVWTGEMPTFEATQTSVGDKRPDSEVSDNFYYIYDLDNDYQWWGNYKIGSAYAGSDNAFNIEVHFDPTTPEYYHVFSK